MAKRRNVTKQFFSGDMQHFSLFTKITFYTKIRQCVCVCEKERERERERENVCVRKRERERERMYV